MYMAPFTFPDPSVQDTVTNPATGDVWIFEDGVWMLADPDDPEGEIPSETPDPPTTDEQITLLMAEIATLRADIINLRAELTAASINNFLILE